MISSKYSNTATDEPTVNRRAFLRGASLAGMGLAAVALLPGCGGGGNSIGVGNQDQAILNAAATAEALATTMYWNLIHSPLYATLGTLGSASDQDYLQAAFEQELIHYHTLVSVGAVPLTTTFYFPSTMFSAGSANFATALNTLITLEDAFIAAYLIGIRDFSTNGNKVIAGQIMGIECEHRALARDIGLDLFAGGDLPAPSTTGLAGQSELFSAPTHAVNNIAFERTFNSKLPNISAVVTALGPFTSTSTGNVAPPIGFAAAAAGSGTVTLDNNGLSS